MSKDESKGTVVLMCEKREEGLMVFINEDAKKSQLEGIVAAIQEYTLTDFGESTPANTLRAINQ